MGIDESGIAEVLVPPHPFKQLIATQHRADMVGELTEQPILGTGHRDLDIVLRHHLPITVQRDIAEALHPTRLGTLGGRRELRPTQQRADAGGELLRDHRLGDVVIGPGLEPGHEILGLGLGRDDDDRNGRGGPQRPADLEPREIGQPQVEQDEIRVMLTELHETRRPIGRLVAPVSLILKSEPEREPDRVVIRDEQQRVHPRSVPRARADTAPRFVTQIAQNGHGRVIRREHHHRCSRCPGEVPPSPWCLTGSGGTRALRQTAASPPATRVSNTVQMALLRSPRLSTRVALFFGLIGLLAGLGLTTATYSIARDSLLDQRVSAARSSAFDNALAVKSAFDQALLPDGRLDREVISDSFLNLDMEPGGFSMLTEPYIPLYLQFPASAFPAELLESVNRTQSGQQQFIHDGEPYIGIGVHIAAYDTSYVEAFPLASTERTLRIIFTALLIGSALAALFATFFGFTTSRGLLKPLTRVADAAGDIAQGALDSRLETSDDPELDRLVQSFNEMADAVQARIEREARFASDVSHELRSPITAMTAAVEVLAVRRDELGDRSQQALDLLVEQVRRFDAMVIDLLELSRLDAGAVDGHDEELDLVEWAQRVTARSGSPDIPVDVERGAPRRAVVDKVRLERILGNLVDNAANHAGGATRVSIEPGDRVGMLLIAVEDAGPGVAASERERIFERFARGSAARHRVGTGLGLALVAEHAAAMGGEAWVEDRPYGGSRFVVRLPRDRSELSP